MLETPFNRLPDFKTYTFLKKGLQKKWFPVNIAKFLRTLEICKQLLLQLLLLTVNIFSWVLDSALNSIAFLQRPSSRFKEFSLGCLVVGHSLIWKKGKISRNGHSLSFVVTRCTTRWNSLSLVVTLCHSLSLVVIRCHSLHQSLSLACLLINHPKFRFFSLKWKAFKDHDVYNYNYFLEGSCLKEKLI